MPEEKNFEREVLDRLITIELTLKTLMTTCPQCQSKLAAHGEHLVAVDASTKSAHHRIDGVHKSVGLVATIIGVVFTLLNFVMNNHK